MIELHVNGRTHACESPEQTPLLWVLREELGYTGVKFGCGVGACGACTVHLDCEAVRSCVMPAGQAQRHRVVTIEGLPRSAGLAEGELHPLQQAWIAQQVPQCGYCQSGMVMAAAALLRRSPHPTDAEIDAAITNLCRCGTYPRVRRAIHQAAGG